MPACIAKPHNTKMLDMAQAKTVAVEVDDQTIQRPWDESDLVTDWSVFPHGYGILLNERYQFPMDMALVRALPRPRPASRPAHSRADGSA